MRNPGRPEPFVFYLKGIQNVYSTQLYMLYPGIPIAWPPPVGSFHCCCLAVIRRLDPVILRPLSCHSDAAGEESRSPKKTGPLGCGSG